MINIRVVTNSYAIRFVWLFSFGFCQITMKVRLHLVLIYKITDNHRQYTHWG